MWVSISLNGRAMTQASSRPLTTETRVQSRVSPCEICGAQCGTGTGPPPRVDLHPVSPIITIPSVLRTYFHLHVALTWTVGRNQGTFPKALLFPKSMSIG